jgi:hypothetical protein
MLYACPERRHVDYVAPIQTNFRCRRGAGSVSYPLMAENGLLVLQEPRHVANVAVVGSSPITRSIEVLSHVRCLWAVSEDEPRGEGLR